jgi:hypothetical protein
VRVGVGPCPLREKETSRRAAETQRRGTRPVTENEIGTIIVESAIAVHRELGSGLLESVYEAALAHEL